MEILKPKLKFKLLNALARLPTKAEPGSAGYDIYSNQNVEIYSKSRKLVSTGLSTEFNKDYYLRIAPRSGLSVKGIDIGAGVIDSSYRGELKVLMINNSETTMFFEQGTRIAQLIMERCYEPDISIVDDLSKSERLGGFGSTGEL